MWHLAVSGHVKWFDPRKDFGFVAPDQGGPDILLHGNLLRDFGRSTVADGSTIVVDVHRTERGWQAIAVRSIQAPETPPGVTLSDLAELDPVVRAAIPLEPARIKWFDKAKGFGFANVWSSTEDVFVHIEVLRRSGFADLGPGEAMGLRIIDGQRGRMAVEVVAWDKAKPKDHG
jgi:CspA family cold shock protein